MKHYMTILMFMIFHAGSGTAFADCDSFAAGARAQALQRGHMSARVDSSPQKVGNSWKVQIVQDRILKGVLMTPVRCVHSYELSAANCAINTVTQSHVCTPL